MAKNRKKELAGTEVAEEIQSLQQGVEAKQTKPKEMVFTPEQRRILGETYELILSWGRKRKMQSVPVISNIDMMTTTVSLAATVDAEA